MSTTAQCSSARCWNLTDVFALQKSLKKRKMWFKKLNPNLHRKLYVKEHRLQLQYTGAHSSGHYSVKGHFLLPNVLNVSVLPTNKMTSKSRHWWEHIIIYKDPVWLGLIGWWALNCSRWQPTTNSTVVLFYLRAVSSSSAFQSTGKLRLALTLCVVYISWNTSLLFSSMDKA